MNKTSVTGYIQLFAAILLVGVAMQRFEDGDKMDHNCLATCGQNKTDGVYSSRGMSMVSVAIGTAMGVSGIIGIVAGVSNYYYTDVSYLVLNIM